MRATLLLGLALLMGHAATAQQNLPWWLDTAQRCANLKATERTLHPRRAARHERLLRQEAELIDARLTDTLTIRGRVTDQRGQPLPGTTVLVPGTAIGAATAADGTYRLVVPKVNKVLNFRLIGYVKQEVQLTRQRAVDVVLAEDKQQLNHVIVTDQGARQQ